MCNRLALPESASYVEKTWETTPDEAARTPVAATEAPGAAPTAPKHLQRWLVSKS